MPIPYRYKAALIVIVAGLLIGCKASLPVSVPVGIDHPSWTSTRIAQWASARRADIRHFKARARICVATGGERSGFDAFILLTGNGRGRMDGLGPWRSPLFSLIFDHDRIYLYLPHQGRLYWGSNTPGHVRQFTGLHLDSSCLFDALAANLPEDLAACSHSVSATGIHCFSCVGEEGPCTARVAIRATPVIEEINWHPAGMRENMRIVYGEWGRHDGYAFPDAVHFHWPEGDEGNIHLQEVKVNAPYDEEMLLPDASWFEGEVVHLDNDCSKGLGDAG
ncbi:MAG: hypothetical protein ACMUIS_00560 [bacterium]